MKKYIFVIINSLRNLEIEAVEDHGVDGGDVKVDRRQSESVEGQHQAQQLPRPTPREDLDVGVAVLEADLDVGAGGCVTVTLKKGEEVRFVLNPLPSLQGFDGSLEIFDEVDRSSDDGCLIALETLPRLVHRIKGGETTGTYGRRTNYEYSLDVGGRHE